jgi:hypothetical protein
VDGIEMHINWKHDMTLKYKISLHKKSIKQKSLFSLQYCILENL